MIQASCSSIKSTSETKYSILSKVSLFAVRRYFDSTIWPRREVNSQPNRTHHPNNQSHPTVPIYATYYLVHYCRLRSRTYRQCSIPRTSWIYRDDTARDRRIDRRRSDCSIVFQTGRWSAVSSGRLPIIDCRRFDRALYHVKNWIVARPA